MNHSFQKYLLVLGLIFIFTLPGIEANLQCRMGYVKCNEVCDNPKHIEGCLKYKSKTQCEICQLNYVLKNGICEFKRPQLNQKCCQQFDYFGQCKKCSKGFYLHPQSKQCIDHKIPGCLQKSNSSESCINCASEYILFNGICLSKIPSCLQYKLNGTQFICKKCSQNYNLIKGQCSKQIDQVNCYLPFKKNSFNKCVITNCKFDYQFGCYQCENGYELTQKGECVLKKIPGCIDYISETQCKYCDQNSYSLIKGTCYPIGCSQLTLSQNLFVCKKCDLKSGYLIQNGICKIPYCILPGLNGCNLCQQGRIWYQGQCILQSQIQRIACINCPSTHFLNQKKECEKKDQGCINYALNICMSCDKNYIYDSINKRCIKKSPGCIYNQKSQCVSCLANYYYNQGKCWIIGCKSYNQTFRCTDCDLRFKLTNLGFCMIQNCIQISQTGCLKCIDNYYLSDGKCTNLDINCAAKNMYHKCIGCKQGYYLDSITNRCKNSNHGCNYIDGRCTSCKTPFIYNPKTQSCFIDGCEQYFFGGCQICNNKYQLRYNNCKLPNCLVSSNGKCLECDPDYIMKTKTNQCVNKDQFCFNYNKQGQCTECAPKYFMSKIKNKCQLRQPGCIYDNRDDCSTCVSPFKPIIGKNKCYLVGCIQSNFDSCRQCKYPFQLDSQNYCIIKNCLKNNDDQCTQCISGYILQNGICTTGDINCAEYNYKSGQCLRCKQGYKIFNNKCQYADSNCLTFTKNGQCSNCLNSYFLNKNKMCQLRDPKCQQYINGRCNKCHSYHYLSNQLCYQNNKGCLIQQSLNRCSKCQSGYKLDKTNRCQFQVKKLNWNSIDMDFGQFTNQQQIQTINQIFTNGKQNKQNLLPCFKSGKGKPFYSTDIDNKKQIHIDSSLIYGWIPKTDMNEYVGVQLQQRRTFYAVDIQCLSNNQMTLFSIEYFDNNVWKQQGTYELVCESIGIIKTIYITPVQSDSLRLVVKKGIPNIKIEFYYNDRIYKIQQNRQQTNIQKNIRQSIDASHQLLTKYCKDGQLCWFGLQICQPKTINGFDIIYDNNKLTGTIDQIYIDYSVDGISFTCLQQCKTLKVNNGKFILNKPVFGSKMRIHVVSYTGNPDMRVQFNYQ